MYSTILVICVVFVAVSATTRYTNKFEFKIKLSDAEPVKMKLQQIGYHYLYKVADVYIFKSNATLVQKMSDAQSEQLKQQFAGKVLAIHQVRELDVSFGGLMNEEPPSTERVNTLPQFSGTDDTYNHDLDDLGGNQEGNLVCKPYYDNGEGIDQAWTLSYTGKGVVVAVTDVGVNIDHPELKQNINRDLSYNFIHNNTDPRPTVFHNYRQSAVMTNHGNGVSSLIAGVKDNNLCSAGVAHGAKIAVLKIFEQTEQNWHRPLLHEDIVAQALNYRPRRIDIYSNSWGHSVPFNFYDLATNAAFQRGITEGRHEKGSIYIFPTGHQGNAFANSIYTIAVNSLGINGTIPQTSIRSSATLVSVFGQGRTRYTESMITAYHNEYGNCTDTFEGSSAATSIVAGIGALALQANAELTWRDIQHIFVESSSHQSLSESHVFKRNGAGRFFHDYFGFGLLNATDVVTLAENWKSVSVQVNNTLAHAICDHTSFQHTICMQCSNDCVEGIEHVVVNIKLSITIGDRFIMTLTSPAETVSTIVYITKEMKISADGRAELLSVHFWGENASGTWILAIDTSISNIDINSASIMIYGTSNKLKTKRKNGDSSRVKESKTVHTPSGTSTKFNASLIVTAVVTGIIMAALLVALLLKRKTINIRSMCRKRYSSITETDQDDQDENKEDTL